MYSASDLRKGLKIEIDGVPYVISEFNFVKPGKGQAIYTCRVKNLITGLTFVKQYRSNDSIEEPKLEERKMSFSYENGDNLVFFDEHFEEVSIPKVVFGDKRYFLEENMNVSVLFHNDRPIDFTMPFFVERPIVETEPGVRGDTATNVSKNATIPGGYKIQVPLFVNQNDIVRIDTRTGEYVDRVSKK